MLKTYDGPKPSGAMAAVVEVGKMEIVLVSREGIARGGGYMLAQMKAGQLAEGIFCGLKGGPDM